MDGLSQQLRYTVRKLRRAPLFTAVAVATLAVGIGSNVAIYSVVDGVLIEPLPYESPDELVGLWHVAPGLGFDHETPVNQSPALHFTYASESRTFASVGVWDETSVSVTGELDPEQVPAMLVTHTTFPILGLQPVAGRFFVEADDVPDAPRTVVLAHGYWQRSFGSDPSVVGRVLTLDGNDHEVIGVAPPGRFIDSSPDLFLPFRWNAAEAIVGNFSYQGIARLRPDVELAEANEDVARMIPIAVERHPGGLTLDMLQEAGFAPYVRPLSVDVVGDVGRVLWVLLGTVAIILLIACANVANLFIVRAEGRQRELAVRTAMGAERGHLVGQLLVESAVLGVVGGALGVAIAWLGIEALVAVGPESLPRLDEIGVDGSALVVAAALSVFASLLFGLFPAVRYAAPNLVASLKEGGRGGSAGRERHLARNGLVVAQMALALVLLTGSGLMIRSFQALRAVDPGFSAPEEVLTFRVTIPSSRVRESEEVAAVHRSILERVRAIPGVEAASYASSVTMDGFDSNDPLEVEDFPMQEGQLPPVRRYKWIGADYVETMGQRLIAGRTLTEQEVREGRPVVVVTADVAADYWPTPGEALGKRVRQFGIGEYTDGAWYEIVGVVSEIHDNGVGEGAVSTVYWPHVVHDFWGEDVFAQRSMAYAVRVTNGDPTALLPAVRDAVWAIDPNLPLARVNTLQEYVERSMSRTSFTLVMLGIAAAVALFLGSVGIYGVISYVVSQRTREIGVRMAMGAERGAVGWMVLRQALALAGLGVVVGMAGAVGLTRLMSSLLFGVSPIDPPTFVAVAVALSAVALVASWLPARRATRVDPVVALRFE